MKSRFICTLNSRFFFGFPMSFFCNSLLAISSFPFLDFLLPLFFVCAFFVTFCFVTSEEVATPLFKLESFFGDSHV